MQRGYDLELELQDVKDYSLEVADPLADHDTVITLQAQKLMEIGYLEYEAAGYGTAYYKDNDIHYYICEKERTMDKFMEQCLKENIYPVPVKYYYKRYDLLKDTEEMVKIRFRYEIARKMQAVYPKILFDALGNLTESISHNGAYVLLKEMSEQLENCFDMNQLKLFGNLLEMMLQSRQLSYEGYLLLKQWLDKECEKIAVEPMASGVYRKTFSGFAYQEPGKEIRYYYDAYPYMTKEKQIKYINRGYLVTPYLTNTYYGSSFYELEQKKKSFESDLRKYLDFRYIKLMELMRNLPATVNMEKYQVYKEQIAMVGSKQADEVFRYYGILWNVK